MFQNYLLEFFGTMFYVYVILATGNPLAIGASIALVILLIRNISGAYLNPAVTIVMAAARQIPNTEVLPYCLAEILGGLVALEIYKRVKAPKAVAQSAAE